MGQWTHFRYGPEGNAVSPDALVGAPNSVRWIADSRAWPNEHFDHLFGAVSAGGQVSLSHSFINRVEPDWFSVIRFSICRV